MLVIPTCFRSGSLFYIFDPCFWSGSSLCEGPHRCLYSSLNFSLSSGLMEASFSSNRRLHRSRCHPPPCRPLPHDLRSKSESSSKPTACQKVNRCPPNRSGIKAFQSAITTKPRTSVATIIMTTNFPILHIHHAFIHFPLMVVRIPDTILEAVPAEIRPHTVSVRSGCSPLRPSVRRSL